MKLAIFPEHYRNKPTLASVCYTVINGIIREGIFSDCICFIEEELESNERNPSKHKGEAWYEDHLQEFYAERILQNENMPIFLTKADAEEYLARIIENEAEDETTFGPYKEWSWERSILQAREERLRK